MNLIIQDLRQSLEEARQIKGNVKSNGHFLTPVLRKIARAHYREQVKTLDTQEIYNLCETLLASRDGAERAVAFQWAFQAKKGCQTTDYPRFERWHRDYVDSWGSCDDFDTHAFGHLIYTYPEHILAVQSWTASANRWDRRGAAVVLIYGIRRGQNFAPAFEIADLLLMDEDDLVQKGYGWMLKEISNKAHEPVFEFVMDRKDRMPRTALRYAIEKMPPALRARAMAK